MPARGPKGASNSAGTKAAKINTVLVAKGRRSHDPYRSLASLPLSRVVDNTYSIEGSQMMSKALLLILSTMAGLSEETMPVKPNQPNSGYRPVIRSVNDIFTWVKSLTFDAGFIIITIAGVTGRGRCISRGPYGNKTIHVTIGGLSLTNKKNSHTLLCGTISDTSAHGMVDLTDPYVKNILPALVRLGVIKDENNTNKEDDDLIFEEEDEVGDAVADALIIEMGKIINPNLIYKKVYHKLTTGKKEKCIYNGTEDYTAGMLLPSQDDLPDQPDNPDEEDDDNSTAKAKPRSQNVKLNSAAFFDDEDEEDDDDEESENVEKVKFESKPRGKGHGRSNNFENDDEN